MPASAQLGLNCTTSNQVSAFDRIRVFDQLAVWPSWDFERLFGMISKLPGAQAEVMALSW
jgi:hypothetical protein